MTTETRAQEYARCPSHADECPWQIAQTGNRCQDWRAEQVKRLEWLRQLTTERCDARDESIRKVERMLRRYGMGS